MQSTDATAAATPPTPSPWPKRISFWGAAAIVIALDQATKIAVRTWLDRGESWPDADWPVRIRHVTNTGAAFGILQDQTLFLIVMAFIGLAAIYLYYRYPPFDHWVVPIAIGMLLGGATGNLLDRVRAGRGDRLHRFPSLTRPSTSPTPRSTSASPSSSSATSCWLRSRRTLRRADGR